QTMEDLNGIPAGEYRVTVSDAANCTATLSVTISQPAPLDLSLKVRNASCSDLADGSIIADITGGTAPYKIVWNGNDLLNSLEFEHALPGIYELYVTDVNGCSVIATAEVLPG